MKKIKKTIALVVVFTLVSFLPVKFSYSNPTLSWNQFARTASADKLKGIAEIMLRKVFDAYNNNDVNTLMQYFDPSFTNPQGFKAGDLPNSLRAVGQLVDNIRLKLEGIDEIIIDRQSNRILLTVKYRWTRSMTDVDTGIVLKSLGQDATITFSIKPEYFGGGTKTAGAGFSLVKEAYADDETTSTTRRTRTARVEDAPANIRQDLATYGITGGSGSSTESGPAASPQSSTTVSTTGSSTATTTAPTPTSTATTTTARTATATSTVPATPPARGFTNEERIQTAQALANILSPPPSETGSDMLSGAAGRDTISLNGNEFNETDTATFSNLENIEQAVVTTAFPEKRDFYLIITIIDLWGGQQTFVVDPQYNQISNDAGMLFAYNLNGDMRMVFWAYVVNGSVKNGYTGSYQLVVLTADPAFSVGTNGFVPLFIPLGQSVGVDFANGAPNAVVGFLGGNETAAYLDAFQIAISVNVLFYFLGNITSPLSAQTLRSIAPQVQCFGVRSIKVGDVLRADYRSPRNVSVYFQVVRVSARALEVQVYVDYTRISNTQPR